jgi:hypothetical protein
MDCGKKGARAMLTEVATKGAVRLTTGCIDDA